MRKAGLAVLAIVVVACGSNSGGSGGASPCPPKTKQANVTGAKSGGGLEEVASFGDNPGKLKMYQHAPPSGHASAVVVAMHGCTQSAADYANAGWNELADAHGFAVIYPEQTSANDAMKCFHWYTGASDTARGAGEAASIAAMTEWAKSTYGATHAFVTGLSAGAAMTAVMLATYPDLFEAGAIMAGLPYGCAKSQTEAYGCMNPGKDATGAAWAALVPDAGATPPRVSIWHGDADWIVRPKNEEGLVKQWSAVNHVDGRPASTETVGKAKHAVYKDASGVARVESWTIAGMGHGTALSPKDGCGAAGAYMLDVGVCSTKESAAFFGLLEGTPDGSGPVGSSGSSGTPRCD